MLADRFPSTTFGNSASRHQPSAVARKARWREWVLVYLLALGVLAGPAYTMYVHYDFSHSLDTRSYLRMARGEFKCVSVTRRYRVLVPAAAGVHLL